MNLMVVIGRVRLLVWSGPALVLAISVLAGYQNWSLVKTKIFWLAAEYFVLLPVLVLIFIGAYRREYEPPGLKPAPPPKLR
jgi:hypothetical protein